MEKNPYIELAECLLPEEMIEYFEVVKVDKTTETLDVTLEERNNGVFGYESRQLRSNGFYEDSARLNLARWYNRVADSGFKSFNTIAATLYQHSDEILNFFNNRSTNPSAESINSKIKAFRAKLHGVNDTKFFIFRLCNIYA